MNQIYEYKDKECPKCNITFKPASGRQRYCGACGRRDKANCVICDKVFEIVNTTGRYCSHECSRKGLYGDWRATKECPVCKTNFVPKREEQKTCSKFCGDNTRKLATQKKREKCCEYCTKTFYTTHTLSKFCSRACSGASNKIIPFSGVCERCGDAIHWTGYKQRFCSQVCRTIPLGTVRVLVSGYAEVKTSTGWKSQHRLCVENDIGRPLLKQERVHHKNGVRNDNRIENLELWYVTKSSKKDPAGQRIEDLIDYVINYHRDKVVSRL